MGETGRVGEAGPGGRGGAGWERRGTRRCRALGSRPPWESSSGGPGLAGGETVGGTAPSSNPDCLPQLPRYIVKVLSTICFIWATSEHYNTPSRVIVILREFCNQIIEMVTFVAPAWPSPPPPPPSPNSTPHSSGHSQASPWSQAWGGSQRSPPACLASQYPHQEQGGKEGEEDSCPENPQYPSTQPGTLWGLLQPSAHTFLSFPLLKKYCRGAGEIWLSG